MLDNPDKDRIIENLESQIFDMKMEMDQLRQEN